MSEPADDEWDFYPCHIDDSPASIFLNLRYEHADPPAAANTLYRIRVQMLEPDEHGMGTASEAEAWNTVEDEVTQRAADADLLYVGRVRTGAVWELAFYGPPQRAEALHHLRAFIQDRRTYLDVRPDPDWGYYREFLLPDAERRQWMGDRRITDLLRDEGDTLNTPRRVDHWAYFPTAEAAAGYTAEAKTIGFACEGAIEEDEHASFRTQLYRDDSVELDHIHGVVVELSDLADRHGGYYDGWETYVLLEVGRPPQ